MVQTRGGGRGTLCEGCLGGSAAAGYTAETMHSWWRPRSASLGILGGCAPAGACMAPRPGLAKIPCGPCVRAATWSGSPKSGSQERAEHLSHLRLDAILLLTLGWVGILYRTICSIDVHPFEAGAQSCHPSRSVSGKICHPEPSVSEVEGPAVSLSTLRLGRQVLMRAGNGLIL